MAPKAGKSKKVGSEKQLELFKKADKSKKPAAKKAPKKAPK